MGALRARCQLDLKIVSKGFTMRKQIQSAAVAAAVAAAFGGSAQAATPIFGTGASAVQKSIIYIIAKDYCSTASTVTYYDNSTAAPTSSTATPGGSIFRIQCTPVSAAKFTSGLDITYDDAGGSWKALTATTPALWANAQNSSLNANPVSTVTPGSGTTFGTITPTILGSTFTFNYVWGATVTSLGTLNATSVTFGLTDVESGLFEDTAFNQPLQNGSWNTGAVPIYSSITPGPELSGFPVKAFGVTFGVAASPALYTALQKDQVASGLLPASCSTSYGTIGSSSNLACVPYISKSQYASIVSANFGALNTNAAALFTNITPSDTSLELARRDQGSGTQAASNAFFLNVGCASGLTENSDLAPALPVDIAPAPTTGPNTTTNNMFVSYNSSTGRGHRREQPRTHVRLRDRRGQCGEGRSPGWRRLPAPGWVLPAEREHGHQRVLFLRQHREPARQSECDRRRPDLRQGSRWSGYRSGE